MRPGRLALPNPVNANPATRRYTPPVVRRSLAALLLALGCTADTQGDEQAWAVDTSSDTSGPAATTESSTTGSSGEAPFTSSSAGESETGDATTGGDPPAATTTRYPSDRTHSPMTAAVAANLEQIGERGPGLADDVFMKVGASSDVSASNLHCFATDDVDLGVHVELTETLELFRAGDAAGTSPFDRESLATEAGRSASWVIAGEPSPLQLEIDAVSPSLAFVHFGTNDMEQGVDPGAALPGFFVAMSALLDGAQQQGIVPIVVGLTRRGDDPAADRWIATYNAVLRAMAQQRQVPFVDAWWAIDPLPGHGLGPDGLHLESYAGGSCDFSELGLQHGYNLRNLIQLEALARTEAAAAGDPPDDDVLPPVLGDGSAQQPWLIDGLPFLHDADTANGIAQLDLYDCSSSDESGPELTYSLELAADTALRIIALDGEGVDVDVHVLAGSGPESCVARDDGIIADTFAAGTWRIVIDSWSDGAVDYAGRFVLAVVPCDAEDPGCGS